MSARLAPSLSGEATRRTKPPRPDPLRSIRINEMIIVHWYVPRVFLCGQSRIPISLTFLKTALWVHAMRAIRSEWNGAPRRSCLARGKSFPIVTPALARNGNVKRLIYKTTISVLVFTRLLFIRENLSNLSISIHVFILFRLHFWVMRKINFLVLR